MPYFLSNFTQIYCKILKIVPINLITDIKTNKKNTNVLVLKYKKELKNIRAH